MVLPSLYRHLFKVLYRGLSLGVVRLWMFLPGLGCCSVCPACYFFVLSLFYAELGGRAGRLARGEASQSR